MENIYAIFISAMVTGVLMWLMHRQILLRRVMELRMKQQEISQENLMLNNDKQRLSEQTRQLLEELNLARAQNLNLATLQGEKNRLLEELQELKIQQETWRMAEQELARLGQEKEMLEEERKVWRQQQERGLSEITEAILHKTEAHTQESHKTMTENLEKVIGQLKSLQDDVAKNSDNCSYLQNALLFPGSNHNFSETTLENLLKSSGLQQQLSLEGSGDFILQAYMQQHDDDNKSRRYIPDAIVKMPNNQFIIVDSKSSKAFGEYCRDLQQQKNSGKTESEQLQKLTLQLDESFRKHLSDLKNKNYAQVLQDALGSKAITPGQSVQITTCLFLQTDAALITLEEYCPNLTAEARDAKIFLVGPTVLNYILDIANRSINLQRQADNFDKIKKEVGSLIGNINMLVKDFSGCGKKLYDAVQQYNHAANLINHKFGLRTNNILKLGFGIETKQATQTIPMIPTIHTVLENDSTPLKDVGADVEAAGEILTTVANDDNAIAALEPTLVDTVDNEA